MRALMVALLVLHAGLVAWIGTRNSPNPDETAHLAAGIAIWQRDRFDLYTVNPPLVRAIAALPIVYGCPEGNWTSLDEEQHDTSGLTRREWSVGIGVLRDNADRAMWFFTMARWACIPLSIVGGYFCWRVANEFYGTGAAALALTLWCFSPNVIAWSATICPDVAAAALGLAASYFFWRWLRKPEWFFALQAGIVLGLAELTKMTWIILFAVWPLLWLVWLWGRRNSLQVPRPKQALQLACILATGLFVLNLGYGFAGTFTKLGDYAFASRTLAGRQSVVDDGSGGNRFGESWLRYVVIPLPRDYVEGMDLQKVDFEQGLPSYLFGQWNQRSWWYYYIICAILKVPLAVWGLGLLAIGMRAGRSFSDAKSQSPAGSDWLDEVVLLLPAIVLIVFVSSQTGFGRHFRYVLPAFPFLFVWIGSVAQLALQRPWTIGAFVVSALAWMVASSLSIYPHSMSFFNELAGGPRGGPRCLLDANIDWGQDIMYLEKWCERHPEATPLQVAFRNSFSDALLRLRARISNLDGLDAHIQKQSGETNTPRELGPKPGWYAVSVHRVHDPNDYCHYFRQHTPVTTVGYSIHIYHISLEEANCLRSGLGLPQLSSSFTGGS